MSNPGVAPPPAEGSITLPTNGMKPGLSIRSILLIMLLLVSTGSSVVVGLIGYHNGRTALEDAATSQLIEVRDSRAREIVSLFESMENTLTLVARGDSAGEALAAFSDGFQQLETAELTPEQRTQIETYYVEDFGGRLDDVYDEPVDVQTFIPTDAAESYLKLNYTVPYSEPGDAIANDDAGDGSAWSAAHSEYHDFFRRMTELFEFEDVLLIDAQGNIVYTAHKGVDLGSNLEDGPLHLTNLGEAYADAVSGNRADVVVLSDFAPYAPSLGIPAAWAVTPVAVDGTVIGAMAVELPIAAINDVMTGGGNWSESGLGETGETYIVGADDQLMRSQSRDMLEHPDEYQEEAVSSGMTPEEAARAVETQQTLLLQPVRTSAVDEAIAGRSGTTFTGGYLGGETIAAYAPLPIDGLDWVIVAEFDAAEALAPVNNFTRNLVLSSALIVVVVSLISLLIAGFIVRPLRRLRDAARRIAAGEVGVQVDAGTSDELMDVGVAFNDMSRSLQVKASLLEEQQAENERLLLSIMPETLVRKYKEGSKTIAFDHQEVSVIFADIVGFEAFSRGLGSEVALERLNEILMLFDEAADRLGIERVRTTRSGYLASCGMSIPRVDNARRVVEFATELQRILERVGGKYGARLALRAGVDTGTVTSGIVGQTHIAFDLWGDAVNLAFQVQAGSQESGIFLTQSVVDRIADLVPVLDWGIVSTQSGPQRIYRVNPESVSVS